MLRSLKMSSTFGGAALAAVAILTAAPGAHAAVITYSATGVNAVNPAEALAASATFTTSAGQIQIVLSNDLSASALASVGQALSDLSFTLSNDAGSKIGASTSG